MSVADVKSHAELERMVVAVPAMRTAEDALRQFRHLTLAKVMGDSILVAGPLGGHGLFDGAVDEALQLLQVCRGRCTAAAAVGSFYAIVTGGTRQPSFFLVGDAIYSVKSQLSTAPAQTTVVNAAFEQTTKDVCC